MKEDREPLILLVDDNKRCSRCGRDLPYSCFNMKRKAEDGLQDWCRECQSEYGSERRIRYHTNKSEAATLTIRDMMSYADSECADTVVLRDYRKALNAASRYLGRKIEKH